MNIYPLIRKILFLLGPENAHQLTLKCLHALKASPLKKFLHHRYENPVTVMGIHFPNPVGLAAGFDKNAEHMNVLGALGFGFLEVGTVTKDPQIGNPKPRIFRLSEHDAIINRMGLNNVGVDQFCTNISNSSYKGILGISITKNNSTPYASALEDYRYCLQKVYPLADYIALDLSCPNVPNFERFIQGDVFNHLLSEIKQVQKDLEQKNHKYVPIAIKVSPDLKEQELVELIEKINHLHYDGVIATNTTLTRPFDHPLAKEKGGLSGPPLYPLLIRTLKILKTHLDPHIAVIAVGGIDSKKKAEEVFNLGADLLQIYSGFIYKGPGLIGDLAIVKSKE